MFPIHSNRLNHKKLPIFLKELATLKNILITTIAKTSSFHQDKNIKKDLKKSSVLKKIYIDKKDEEKQK